MTVQNLLRSKIRLATIPLVLLFPLAAHALTQQQVESGLPQLLAQQQESGRSSTRTLSSEENSALAALIFEDPAVQSASELTLPLVNDALKGAFIGRLSEGVPAETQVQRVRTFLTFQNEEDPLPMVHDFMAAVEDAGLCDEVASGEGIECSFAFSSDDADISAEVVHSNGEDRKDIGIVDKSFIEEFLPDSCNVGTEGLPVGVQDTGAQTQSTQAAAAASVSPYCLDTAYGYALYYRYDCDIIDGCTAVAEASGAITASYLYTTADTVGAIASAAIKCDWECIVKSGLDYAFGNKKFFEYLYKNSDKKNRDV